MKNLSVDWETISRINPNDIVDGKDTADGVFLVFKNGAVICIKPDMRGVGSFGVFHRFHSGDMPIENALTVEASMYYGENSYNCVSVDIHIGKYRYFQHGFVELSPQLDANSVCAMRMYESEEEAYGSESR